MDDGTGPGEAILAVLREHPGRRFKVAELAIETGLSARRTGTALANYSRRRTGGARSEWRHVSRVAHGIYVYDPTPREEPTAADLSADASRSAGAVTWEMVERDEDVIVLRGPDGRLYAARPLANIR